jgi:hypothetical protein
MEVLGPHPASTDAVSGLVGGRFWERGPPDCHVQGVWSILLIFVAATALVIKFTKSAFVIGQSLGVLLNKLYFWRSPSPEIPVRNTSLVGGTHTRGK